MADPNDSSYYITDTNKTPLIQIVTWFLLASAVLCALCRAYTKYAVIRVIGKDDYSVLAALILLIAQSIAVTISTTNGYGKPQTSLSEKQIQNVEKAQYAASLLYIPSLFFSKLPTVVLLRVISPAGRFLDMLKVVFIVIVGWALSSEFTSAFQCTPPETWNRIGGHCIDKLAFVTYLETVNAFTDALLVLLPLGLIFLIQTSLTRKFSVIIVFCARLLPLSVSVVKISLAHSDVLNPDPFFGAWPITICTQLIQLLSLLAACILHLRPFLESLTSGFINGDDLRRRGRLRPYGLTMAGSSDDAMHLAHTSDRNTTTNTTQSSRRNRWERSWTFRRGRWASRDILATDNDDYLDVEQSRAGGNGSTGELNAAASTALGEARVESSEQEQGQGGAAIPDRTSIEGDAAAEPTVPITEKVKEEKKAEAEAANAEKTESAEKVEHDAADER